LQSDNEQLKDRLLNLENELHSLRDNKKEENASNYNSQERNLLVSYLSGSFENKTVHSPKYFILTSQSLLLFLLINQKVQSIE